MTRTPRHLVAAVAIGLGLTATACSGGSGALSAADLQGKTFETGIAKGQELVDGAPIRIEFLDGRISANAGCNTINAPAEVADGTLTLTAPAAATMMFCDGVMDQEQWFSTFIESEPTLELKGATLTMKAGEIELELHQTEDADGAGDTESAESGN